MKQVTQSILMTICVIFVLGFCSRSYAQAGIDQGSITGTVKDPSGALVVHATCTLTNSATGVAQKTVTTSAGAYAFPFVNIGTYSLKVEATGFESYDLTRIAVHLGTTDTEDVRLKVGGAAASVTVTSAAPLLQAQDASLGMTIDSAAISELPLFGGSQGRSIFQLMTIAPDPVLGQRLDCQQQQYHREWRGQFSDRHPLQRRRR